MTDTDAFRREVLEGLSREQKALSPKWLYDAEGSALFEEITRTEDYYPTRTERAVMAHALPALAERLKGAAVAEFGSGASVKSEALIEALMPSVYVPIDIAAGFMEEAAERLRDRFGDLKVQPVAADFTKATELPPAFTQARTRLGFFPGSTIGNFDAGGAEAFLREARGTLGEGAWFLVGADQVKDTDVLLRAYDDRDGVTRAFNLNLLTRINRELGADFDTARFRHEARWNEARGRIEMHLVSALPQTVTLAGQRFAFAEGESIHTENSHKYTRAGFEALCARAGWRTEEAWTDEKGWFEVALLRTG
jgi:dimethylhistidine N-methyltransferase